MNKIIRWPGLIGFLAVCGTISAVILLFLDTWIKLATTAGLEQATGAEVNIESVSHRFSPFGVTFSGVQLTDPNKPTHNQIQAQTVQADIELAPLLMRKIIIDNLTMTGVAFAQPRAIEGKVYRAVEADSERAELPTFSREDIPSVDEILARSPLKTTKAAEQAQAAYDKHRTTLQQQYDALPDKATLADYKKQIETLTKTEYKDPVALAKAKQQFDQLREKLKQDKQKLSDFKQSVQQAKTDLGPKLAALRAAPGEDYDQLKALIAGDQGAIENVTRMVLGDKAAVWSDYLLSTYKVVVPMLKGAAKDPQEQRGAGQWIEFAQQQSLPDFWIKRADIGVAWQQEVIASTWQDITHQHDIIGKATTFNIDSTASKLWQSLQLDGQFSLFNQQLQGSQNWDLKGVVLDNIDLLSEQKLTTQLLNALLNSQGQVAVNNGTLQGAGKIDLRDLSLQASGTNNLTQVIAETLNGLNALQIDTALSGAVDRPKVKFSSDLDKRIAQAMLANLSGDQKSKLNELKSKLSARVSGPLGKYSEQMGQLGSWESLADGNLSSVDEMLNAQLKSLLDSEKDKIKDKLKDKLFGKGTP